VNWTWTVWACCSIIRRMASAVSRLLTITILSRSHDHILNIVVYRKIYCWFLHFNFLLGTDQWRFWLLLRYRRRSMMIWIRSSINEIAHFWSMMIMMIPRCSMPMMNTSMRLTWILEMIATCWLTQISTVSFLWMSSIFSWPDSCCSLRTRSGSTTRLINSN
jgi:hypothetical protein